MKKILVVLLCSFVQVYACTDFMITAKDKSFVTGRSMEFSVPLDSSIFLHGPNQSYQSTAPKGRKAVQWTSKYGFLGVGAFGGKAVTDGLNTEGLAAGLLWLPTTEYPSTDGSTQKPFLAINDIVNWILGQFKGVDEVLTGLESVRVWGSSLAGLGEVPPLHLSLHDASGKSAVVEFLDGEIYFYPNPIGTLTNYPPFEWQIVNLQNYLGLTAEARKPIELDGVEIKPTGEGSGLMGVPGDLTPPSRFVKIAYSKNLAMQAEDAKGAINLALHLLNTVDIPYGLNRNSEGQAPEYTQWAVVRDLTNRTYSYRTYSDLNLKTIDVREKTMHLKEIETIEMVGQGKP